MLAALHSFYPYLMQEQSLVLSFSARKPVASPGSIASSIPHPDRLESFLASISRVLLLKLCVHPQVFILPLQFLFLSELSLLKFSLLIL